MKKISIISFLIVATAFNFSACKSETKKEENKEAKTTEVKTSSAAFSVANAKNDIKFTAYKTTEKIGVGGQFDKIDIIAGGEGNSVKEAINNTEFSIPVSSLATKDSSRDFKIRKFFFGAMADTKLLTGKLSLTTDKDGIAKITMNGKTEDVLFTYTIVDKTFNMQTTIDINNWNAGEALASLNKVCEILHTGADGVSKTWSDVALNITTTF
ncbi:YceI family protein [Polaribacter vadi]|uniref:YceI family protein n=1 Tax=Polaribacter TaxID=52959 RepID=UPI001C084B37|nr:MULTISPECIES: YceI family protein [Polaribacter]MBU3012927.1 YceI family protein [Polaribacter vadi]MDO6742745.1 YceI family protein [Polaribacter sp. 1_MG-2023]